MSSRRSIALLAAAVLWLCCGVVTTASATAPMCHLGAQVTPDNDIRLGVDSRPRGSAVEVPSAVQGKITAVAGQLLARMQLEPQWFKCAELYPALFRISVSPEIHLYVADLALGSGVEYFLLILHDVKTGAVTSNPPLVHATSTQAFGWKDSLLARPLVSFANLIGNRREIVLEERVHNGTVYNAVVYNYFEMGPGLALTRVLAVEKRALAIGEQQGIITRDLSVAGAGKLRLDTFLNRAKPFGKRQDLGYVILESPGPGLPFHVTQRHGRDKVSEAILVTYCGPDTPGDDVFLREGYTFHY